MLAQPNFATERVVPTFSGSNIHGKPLVKYGGTLINRTVFYSLALLYRPFFFYWKTKLLIYFTQTGISLFDVGDTADEEK